MGRITKAIVIESTRDIELRKIRDLLSAIFKYEFTVYFTTTNAEIYHIKTAKVIFHFDEIKITKSNITYLGLVINKKHIPLCDLKEQHIKEFIKEIQESLMGYTLFHSISVPYTGEIFNYVIKNKEKVKASIKFFHKERNLLNTSPKDFDYVKNINTSLNNTFCSIYIEDIELEAPILDITCKLVKHRYAIKSVLLNPVYYKQGLLDTNIIKKYLINKSLYFCRNNYPRNLFGNYDVYIIASLNKINYIPINHIEKYSTLIEYLENLSLTYKKQDYTIKHNYVAYKYNHTMVNILYAIIVEVVTIDEELVIFGDTFNFGLYQIKEKKVIQEKITKENSL